MTEKLKMKNIIPSQAPTTGVSRWASPRKWVALIAVVLLTTLAGAQLPVPASSQFDITGFIQSATLGGAGSGSGTGARQGGFITVNGHLITVPSNTIVILPASALTWQELFAFAPAPYTGVATGMAAADVPAPLTTYEAHVVGNRVLGGPGGADVYIAGLIWISQQALNSGQGFINCISYALPALAYASTIQPLASQELVATEWPSLLTFASRWTRTIRRSRLSLVTRCAFRALTPTWALIRFAR
jgi:hypothetical protein